MIKSKLQKYIPVTLSLCSSSAYAAVVVVLVYDLLAPQPDFSGPMDCIRAGQSAEVGMLADYRYAWSRDLWRAMTVLSALAVVFVPLAERKKANRQLVALELAGLALIPWSVHLIGSFAVNNMGAIAGGL